MARELSRPGHERQIQRLIQTIKRAQGGSLWFVVGGSMTAHEEIVARVSAEVSEAHDIFRVDVPAGSVRPFEQIVEVAAGSGRPRPVVVAWCGRSASGALPDTVFWQDLNLGREARGRGGWHLILWVAGLDGLDAVRDAAPDLWSHRTGVVLALTAEDFAHGAAERALAERPTLAARIDSLLATSSIDENTLANELRFAASLGGADPLHSGCLVRLTAGNVRVRPGEALLATHDHAQGSGGDALSAQFSLISLEDGTRLPLQRGTDRASWQGLQDWIASEGAAHPATVPDALSHLAQIAVATGRCDLAVWVHSEYKIAVNALSPDQRAAQVPYVHSRCAASATLAWRTLEALEQAHAGLVRFASHGGGSPGHLTRRAANLYALMGQPSDAAALISGTQLAPVERLDACTVALDAGTTSVAANTRALIAQVVDEAGDRATWEVGGHPRLRARALLVAAEALRVLGNPEDLEHALVLLGKVHSLPVRVPFLPPLSALGALRTTSLDPVERGLARLRDQIVRRRGFRNLADALPRLPQHLEIEIDAVGDLAADAWRLEAKIRAHRGEWTDALTVAARAEDSYAREGATENRVGVLVEAAKILLDQDQPEFAGACLNRAEAALESERSQDVDLRPVALVVDLARHRARAAIALGDPAAALPLLEAARALCVGAANAEQEFEVSLGVAALPREAAPWEIRSGAAQRALAMASEASLLVAEGRALFVWFSLLQEAQRHAEAAAALGVATWIRDRCPASALVKAHSVSQSQR